MFEWLFLSDRPLKNAAVVGGTLFGVQLLLLLGSGHVDGSLFLPGDDLGVFEHAGIWAIICGDWLILFAVAMIMMQVRKISARFPARNSALSRRYLRHVQRRLVASLKLSRPDRQIFSVLVLFGLMFWLNNAYQTRFPVEYYGNDLFDSSSYLYGYVTTRIILSTSWVLFLPYMGFVSICIANTIYKSVKTSSSKLLQFKTAHPDGCGGFSFFGNFNLAFVFGIFIIYLELTAVLFTHDKLNPGLLSGFICVTIVFVAASYFMLLPVYEFLSSEKRRQSLQNYLIASRDSLSVTGLGQHIFFQRSSFSPYNMPQRILLSSARILPIMAATLRIYQSLGHSGA